MTWLKRIAVATGMLAVLLGAALWWLLGSSAGMHFVLARVVAATHGALSVQQSSGHLAGPLTLRGVHYADGEGLDVRIEGADVHVAFWPLLGARLHVRALSADGILVSLPTERGEQTAQAATFSLKPPIDITVDKAQISNLQIQQGQQALFAADQIALGGGWTHAGIVLTQLRLRASDGHADASGTLAIGRRYRGNGKVDFAWTLGDTEYAGKLSTRSDGRMARAELTLVRPMPFTAVLQLAQRDDYPWQLTVQMPRANANSLLGEGSIRTLGADLTATGNHHGGQLTGTLDVNDWPIAIQTLRATLSDDFSRLTVQQLEISSKRIKGMLSAKGQLQLDAQPLAAQFDVAWQDLQLPPELAGQTLDSHGELHIDGDLANYKARGDIHVGPPGKPAHLQLDLTGTDQRIDVRTLDLKQANGGMQASGTLNFRPHLAWQFKANGEKFDPGQLFVAWPGALDFDLDSQGDLAADKLDASLAIKQLDGTLRQRTVKGHGTLHLAPNKVVDGKLNIAVGASTLDVQGRPGVRNDIHVTLAVASLADWLPDAEGALHGDFRLQGKLAELGLSGELSGRDLRWQQQRAGTVSLDMNMPDIGKPAGRVQLKAGDVSSAGLTFTHVDIDANGTEARHSAQLVAKGPQLSANMTLAGSVQGRAWQGQLSALNLQPQGMPDWRLEKPAAISWKQGVLDMSTACLSAGEPTVCVNAHRDVAGRLDAGYRLTALPLQLLDTLASSESLPISAQGAVHGEGQLSLSAAGTLTGHASLTSERGEITHLDAPGQPLLAWHMLRANADLDGTGKHLEVHAQLADQGSLDGRVNMTGPQQLLDGHLEIHLNNLAFAELLKPEVANVNGRMDGQFRIQGTLQHPVFGGQAIIDQFAAEIPTLGLKLEKGRFTLATTDTRQLRLDGQVQSGKGQLDVHGLVGVGADESTTITIKGDQVEAADIPAARLVVSPDLVFKQSANSTDLSGSLHIERADIDVSRLPGAGASKTSADVVVMDAPKTERGAAASINVTVKVDLGDKTHLNGFGLNGMLRGVLTVIQRPGREALGQGQIRVDGTYRAYGQNLHIERGQLLFASTPLDNPGLNIRAVRKLNPNATIDDGNEVGLLVSGTAQRPILTVFSKPLLEQSDALSYLVTGKPLSQVKGGEGNLVGAAAQALGSAAGDLLAKSVGSKMGLDDIGVSSNEALGGGAAFTVGKYLSPRLYLNYGVGLFEPGTVITLRYILSPRWNFEATQASEFARASFNYRYEK